MSTPELTIRLTMIVLGTLLMGLGGILAYRDREQGCLPFVLLLFGLLMVGAGFPGEAIFQ